MSETRPNPYPGLRAFQSEEDHLFFGREEQTAELLRRLGRTRFVAVVGASGSGKSSLVRCGLLSELHGGGLVDAGSTWEVAVMQPGGDPAHHLAQALIDADLYDSEDADVLPRLLATLSRSRHGLSEAIAQSEMEPGGNLLLVVDQFEELFRFREKSSESADDAVGFVRLLLEATRQSERRIYVVLTMRSDFLGDCAQFSGLAEAVNNGEYLIPRLNRDQTQLAIEGPARVSGGALSRRLVQRLLLDMEDDADRLPVMQHGLMRLWDAWSKDHAEGEPMDLRHYEAIGSLAMALSQHADEVLTAFPEDQDREVAERLFKALTESGEEGRKIRRPQRFADLVAIGGGHREAAQRIVEAYRCSGVTLLMPPDSVPLGDDTVVDISHESLMRVWERLRYWVEEEAKSAGIYRRLAETATLWKAGEAGLYREPDLPIAHSWREETAPNAAWAELYGGGYKEAMAFLEESDRAAHQLEVEKEAARQRELEQAQALAESRRRSALHFKVFSAAVGVLCLVAIGFAFMFMKASQRAEAATKEARHLDGRNWLANAEDLEQEKDAFGAQLKAARAVGFEGWGREMFSKEQARELPVLLDQNAPDETWNQAQNLVGNNSQATLLWQAGSLPQHQKEARGLAFSPDGRILVSIARSEHRLTVWDVASGLKIQTIDTRVGRGPRALAFSPDGAFLVYAGGTGVDFLRYRDGALSFLKDRPFTYQDMQVRSLAFTPDGARLLLCGQDVYVWENWREFREDDFPGTRVMGGRNLEMGGNDIEKIAFNPSDSGQVALHSGDIGLGATEIIDISLDSVEDEARKVATLRPPEEFTPSAIWGLAFSPDGSRLVTAGHRIPVMVWDLATKRVEAVLLGKEFESTEGVFFASDVSFSMDGKQLAVGWGAMNDRAQWAKISFFAIPDRKSDGEPLVIEQTREIELDARVMVAMDWSLDGRFVALGPVGSEGEYGAVQVWDLEQGRRVGEARIGHSTAVQALAFSSDGLYFASGDARGHISVWEARSGRQVRRYQGHDGGVAQLCFSAAGDRLFSVGGQSFKAWDVASGAEIFAAAEAHALRGLDVSPDGSLIAVAGDSERYQLYHASDLTSTREIVCEDGADRLKFVSSGRALAVYSTPYDRIGDGAVTIYGIEDGRRISRRPLRAKNKQGIYPLAVSPDGRTMASASEEGLVRIWEENRDRKWSDVRRTFVPEHDESVPWLAFRPDGRWLATGSGKEVKCWKVGEGGLQLKLSLPEEVTRFAFSPDGNLLLTGGKSGLLQLWSVSQRPELLDTVNWSETGRSTMHGFFEGTENLALAPSRQLFLTRGKTDKPNALLAWRWDRPGEPPVFALEGHRDPVGAYALSPDERFLASSTTVEGSPILLWDLDSQTSRPLVESVNGTVYSLFFSPDGRTLACTIMGEWPGERGGVVHFFDAATGEAKGSPIRGEAPVTWLEFTADGTELFMAIGPKLTRWRFDPNSRECILLKEVESQDIDDDGPKQGRAEFHRFAIHPKGGYLATTSSIGKVYVNDLATLEPIGDPIDAGNWSVGIRFSPDGGLLAIGHGGDAIVRLHEGKPPFRPVALLGGEELREMGSFSVATTIHFLDGGRYLAYGINRPTLPMYELPIRWDAPDPARYLDVVRFDEASGALNWKLENLSLHAPTEARVFRPLDEAYLPFLDEAGSDLERHTALFHYYMGKGLWQAAQGVLLSMKEEAPESWWNDWREASGGTSDD